MVLTRDPETPGGFKPSMPCRPASSSATAEVMMVTGGGRPTWGLRFAPLSLPSSTAVKHHRDICLPSSCSRPHSQCVYGVGKVKRGESARQSAPVQTQREYVKIRYGLRLWRLKTTTASVTSQAVKCLVGASCSCCLRAT